MKYCTNCGKEIANSEQKFCVNCGKSLSTNIGTLEEKPKLEYDIQKIDKLFYQTITFIILFILTILSSFAVTSNTSYDIISSLILVFLFVFESYITFIASSQRNKFRIIHPKPFPVPKKLAFTYVIGWIFTSFFLMIIVVLITTILPKLL